MQSQSSSTPAPAIAATQPADVVQAPQAAGAAGGSQAPSVRVEIPGVSGASATEVLQGFRAQRRELREQLEDLEEKRQELADQLKDPMVGGASRAGLEARIAELDQRILATDQQIAAVEGQVARAAAVPGAVVPEPQHVRSGPDEDVVAGVAITVTLFVLFPLAFAYARRIWKRGSAVVTAIPAELYERLTRIEQSVDTVAVEVERIGEGQRFVTRVLTEPAEARAVSRGEAQPVEAPPGAAGPSVRR